MLEWPWDEVTSAVDPDRSWIKISQSLTGNGYLSGINVKYLSKSRCIKFISTDKNVSTIFNKMCNSVEQAS